MKVKMACRECVVLKECYAVETNAPVIDILIQLQFMLMAFITEHEGHTITFSQGGHPGKLWRIYDSGKLDA